MSDDKKYTGTVIFFENKLGYGFLQRENNEVDLFVHFSDIVSPAGGFKTLKKGQKVEFGIGQNNKGEPKAINVVVISDK